MFDPILAPDAHRGPATGHTSEFGTTWQECAARINAAFKTLFERGEVATTGVSREIADAINARFEKAEAEITSHKDALSELLFKVDALEEKLSVFIHSIPAAPPTEPPPQPEVIVAGEVLDQPEPTVGADVETLPV